MMWRAFRLGWLSNIVRTALVSSSPFLYVLRYVFLYLLRVRADVGSLRSIDHSFHSVNLSFRSNNNAFRSNGLPFRSSYQYHLHSGTMMLTKASS